MLLDASDVQRDAVLHADLLVIGAGAAGITIARAVTGSNLSAIVLESGGLEADDATQDLAHATASHDEYPVDLTRLRFLGGTTNHWGGWCRAMDPWVFEHRPWVTDVGWPFEAEDLDDYYRTAAGVVELPTEPTGWTWDWNYWRKQLPEWGYEPLLDNEVVGGAMFRFSPPTRFGTKYRDDLRDSRNVRIVLNANALELRTDPSAARVTEVPVATLDGNRFTVTAREVVVAVGALEVPRLLLLSDSTRPKGLGNDNDLVGRYFMDHIEGSVGTLELGELPKGYMGGVLGNGRAMLALTAEAMQRDELLGCAVTFDVDNYGVAKYADEATGVTASGIGKLRTAVAGGASHAVDVLARAEPKPMASSRVVLTDERDALGQRRLELQYARSPDTQTSVQRTLEVFARELGAAGIGRMRIALDDTEKTRFEIPTVGFHLMGTTRMADDPKHGVVDANLRVHGTDNLYVASSSVFPTVGYSNPTLTIVALALRLADHLKLKIQ